MVNVVDYVIESKKNNIETCSDYNKNNISEVVSRIIISYLNFTKKYTR